MKTLTLIFISLTLALAACTTPVVTQPMYKSDIIPAKFQGIWASPGACGKESPITIFIKPTRVDYYESHEDVHDIYVQGNTMTYTATAIGEGETRSIERTYMLSNDGNILNTPRNLRREKCTR